MTTPRDATPTPDKPIGVVMLPGCRCRCGHEWLSRAEGEKPRVCPKCKTPNWDRPKKWERKIAQD